jgi:hypothetical protein
MKVGLSLILLAISYTSSLVFNILHFSFFTDTEIDSEQGGSQIENFVLNKAFTRHSKTS